MYKPNYKSKCCGARVEMRGSSPDFIGDKRPSTYNFYCKKCKKPCDIKDDSGKVPASN